MSPFLRSTKKRAAMLWVAVGLCLTFAAGGARAATVTFGVVGGGGKLTAFVKETEREIRSGDAVSVYENVKFTASCDEGYDIDKWWQDGRDVGNVDYVNDIIVIVEMKPINVTVSFKPGYTVRFDANGGTVVPESGATTNRKLSSLPTPAKTDYAFEGWYTAPTGGTKVVDSSTITLNTTVYAHWTLTRQQAATVTFGVVGDGGTLTAAVLEDDGWRREILSGDSVSVGKEIAFTAVCDEGYGIARWMVNGTDIVDTCLMYTRIVEDSNAVDVTVSFEILEAPPDSGGEGTGEEALSGGVMVGPNPVRAGGDMAVYWVGNKAVSGSLSVFDVIGNKVVSIDVNGVNKIGAWKVGGIAGGTYLIKGVLTGEDGGKVKVSKLVGVVR
ncbi:MAG: InlB B-repeat-containing protein [Chitinispirillales bacterium]|jgi:uncharacterized repeat protein (TIGR02543 family)|nr:InlB B-repeat-containing protein [Chitinispirillales bacterium]